MASLDGFNAEQVDPNFSFDPIPAGDYLAIIIASERKKNRANTAELLELTFQVVDGPYKGRQLRTWLNLYHPNETAQKIAQAELSAICRAVGVLRPKDSAELHNLPLVVTVKVKRRSDNDETVNEASGYKSKQAAAANTQAAAPAEDSNVPPWKR